MNRFAGTSSGEEKISQVGATLAVAVAIVRTDFSEGCVASNIRVKRTSEQGTPINY
jgi:hypothetical protein